MSSAPRGPDGDAASPTLLTGEPCGAPGFARIAQDHNNFATEGAPLGEAFASLSGTWLSALRQVATVFVAAVAVIVVVLVAGIGRNPKSRGLPCRGSRRRAPNPKSPRCNHASMRRCAAEAPLGVKNARLNTQLSCKKTPSRAPCE